MRESLTVLAILLIVVLTTALVGPYFIDWNAHRGQIEARLSQWLGAKVSVAGPIDVKLLPRPIFRLADVRVSGNDAAAGSATVARLDTELSLTALLRGEIAFVEADVLNPVITLPLGPDGTVRLPTVGEAEADRISLVHVAINDGSLMLKGADGRTTLAAGGLDGEGEAEALVGPFKFSGSVDTARGPLTFRIATGVIESGRFRLKATIGRSAGAPKTDFDGLVSGATGDAHLMFDGTLASDGSMPLAGSAAVVPWTVTAKLHAEPGRAELSAGELRAGRDGRALVATLSGTLSGGARPQAEVTLKARQADVGRLAVAPGQNSDDDAPPDDPSAVAPKLGNGLATLAALAGNADLTTALPMPLILTYGVDTVSAGQLTLVDLGGTVAMAPGQPITGTLSVGVPDGGQLALDGRFEPGTAAVFKGRARASTRHLQRLAADLAPDLPVVAAAIRQTLPVDEFRAAGSLDLSAVGFAAHDATVTLDRSSFAGTITLTRAVGPDHARLFADLTSDALDLDALPDWRDTARTAADLDVSLSLVAHALRLAPSDTGSVNAGRIAVTLNKRGPAVTLDRLSLSDVGGATAEITGRSDGQSAHAEGRVDARSLRAVLGLADRLAPGTVTDRLLERADALSPAVLTVAGDAAVAGDGSISPTLLTLDGTAAATKVNLRLRPDGTARPRTDETPGFVLDLKLDAPDSVPLLRQLGFQTAGGAAVGHGHLDLSARRNTAGTIAGTLAASFGDTTLTLDGRRDPGGHGTARLSLKGPNVALPARALRLASPEPGTVWPAEATGTLSLADNTLRTGDLAGRLIGTGFKGDLALTLPSGTDPAALSGSLTVDRLPLPTLAGLVLGPLPLPKPGAVWPDAPFGPTVLALPRGALALTVPSLPLTPTETASDARATLRLAPGSLTLGDLSATLGDGRIGGTVTLRRDGPAASLAGHVEWSGLPLSSPAIGGISHGTLDLAGTGTSVATLMAGLAGSGTLGLQNGRLPRFDPGAIAHVIANVDASAGTVDDGAISASLGQDLDRGALPLGPAVETPVTVAAGTLRVAPVRVTAGGVQAEASGSLDLASLLLSLRTTATQSTPPKDWVGAAPQVGAVWKGPLASPARDVDAATLVNGIAARAIARDQARIQDFQDDIRERARFAAQLRHIEAEQQAARDKARADAEADRKRLQDLIQGALPGASAEAARPARPDGGPITRRPAPPGPEAGKPLELH